MFSGGGVENLTLLLFYLLTSIFIEHMKWRPRTRGRCHLDSPKIFFVITAYEKSNSHRIADLEFHNLNISFLNDTFQLAACSIVVW